MIKTIGISLVLLITTNFTFSQEDSIRIRSFYEFMGEEKESIIKETLICFNEFLETNFDTVISRKDRIDVLLNAIIKDGFSSEIKWQYDIEKIKALIDNFEKSGLRKDIWVYGKELINHDTLIFKYVRKFTDERSITYNRSESFYEAASERMLPLNMDSIEKAKIEEKRIQYENSIIFSDYSLTLFGLDIYKSYNQFIQDYIEYKFNNGSSIYSKRNLIDKVLSFDEQTYLDPYCDVILVMDYFYLLMYVNVENLKQND